MNPVICTAVGILSLLAVYGVCFAVGALAFTLITEESWRTQTGGDRYAELPCVGAFLLTMVGLVLLAAHEVGCKIVSVL